jgi:hypothetical protein
MISFDLNVLLGAAVTMTAAQHPEQKTISETKAM